MAANVILLFLHSISVYSWHKIGQISKQSYFIIRTAHVLCLNVFPKQYEKSNDQSGKKNSEDKFIQHCKNYMQLKKKKIPKDHMIAIYWWFKNDNKIPYWKNNNILKYRNLSMHTCVK